MKETVIVKKDPSLPRKHLVIQQVNKRGLLSFSGGGPVEFFDGILAMGFNLHLA